MPEKVSYPQLPSTVWWGVRAVLNRTPNATLDERFLSIQLGVQEAAARQYVAELKRVGILNDEGKGTRLAHSWRLDESYGSAVDELVKKNYPDGLMQVAPPENAERSKATAWFQREGLGSGAAGNKAATYLLIASQTPHESPAKGLSGEKRIPSQASRGSGKAVARPNPSPKKVEASDTRSESGKSDGKKTDMMPLNINVQIHIGADASTDQIETIFSAMRRYLYNNEPA